MELKQLPVITKKKTHKRELWLKMSDKGIKLEHSNIDDFVSKRIRKYYGKT